MDCATFLQIKTIAPFALAALIAQGCGGFENVGAQNNTGTTTGNSSAPATTGTATPSSGPSAGTGSTEQGPAGTGTGTSSDNSASGSSSTGDQSSSDSTKEETNSSTSDQSSSSTSDQSTSSDSTQSSSDSTDSSGTDSSGTETEEKGDDKVKLTWIETGLKEQLIGLDARNTRNIWVGGQGLMMQSRDNGETWERHLVSKTTLDSSLEFRDVEVVGMRTVYALAAGKGEKSRIFKTTDAGLNWTEQYKAKNENAFINCMDFADRTNGFVFGDSFGGAHFMLRTENGRSWKRVDTDLLPTPLDNEGGFSASGTCAISADRNTYMAVTGGADKARLLKSDDRGDTWEAYEVPVVSGAKKQGLTSLVMWSQTEGLAFAADLDAAEEVADVLAYTKDGGETWEKRDMVAPARGIFGGAANSDGSVVIAVGPGGMHYSTDKGVTWTQISERNLWSVDFADDKTAFAVGAQGRVVRIEIQ